MALDRYPLIELTVRNSLYQAMRDVIKLDSVEALFQAEKPREDLLS